MECVVFCVCECIEVKEERGLEHTRSEYKEDQMKLSAKTFLKKLQPESIGSKIELSTLCSQHPSATLCVKNNVMASKVLADIWKY